MDYIRTEGNGQLALTQSIEFLELVFTNREIKGNKYHNRFNSVCKWVMSPFC